MSSVEAVSLDRVRSVVVSRVVADPEHYRAGQLPAEVTLTLGWGAVQRLELEPAGCSDPTCEADHGYTGTTTTEDLALRISGAAEGETAVRRALDFAGTLSRLLAAPPAADPTAAAAGGPTGSRRGRHPGRGDTGAGPR